MRRFLCWLGFHRWQTDFYPQPGGYSRLRKTCTHCPARKYGWKRFGLEHGGFGWTGDRSAWEANPAILDPERMKVTR